MPFAKDVKPELQELVRLSGIRMIDSGLTVATWGNISCCDRETGLMYITPSGMNYHEIVDDDINVYDLEGNLVQGHRRPSIEHDLHRGMYNARPEISACVHTHPIFSTVFSSMGEDIPINLHDEAAQALGDTVRCADYCLPGTVELANAAVKAMGKKSNACLLRNHGAVCIGADMDGAFKVSTVLEMVAEIYWRIRATGGTYIPISDENVAAMQVFVKTKYGQY
jgi:L-fuculose-phosphate aldolase